MSMTTNIKVSKSRVLGGSYYFSIVYHIPLQSVKYKRKKRPPRFSREGLFSNFHRRSVERGDISVRFTRPFYLFGKGFAVVRIMRNRIPGILVCD